MQSFINHLLNLNRQSSELLFFLPLIHLSCFDPPDWPTKYPWRWIRVKCWFDGTNHQWASIIIIIAIPAQIAEWTQGMRLGQCLSGSDILRGCSIDDHQHQHRLSSPGLPFVGHSPAQTVILLLLLKLFLWLGATFIKTRRGSLSTSLEYNITKPTSLLVMAQRLLRQYNIIISRAPLSIQR